MNDTRSPSSRADLSAIHTLARLLERLEGSTVAIGADQYHSVAARLAEALERVAPGAGLDAVLDAHPAAAELYENLHYKHAGLCRRPLAFSLATEAKAKEAIGLAMRGTTPGVGS